MTRYNETKVPVWRKVLPAMCAMVLLGQMTAAGSAESARPAWCRPSGNLRAEEMPQRARAADCPMQGRAIVDYGDTGTEVPPPGTGVYAESIFEDGSTQVLQVKTEADGTVVLDHVGDDMGHEHSAEDSGEMELAVHSTSLAACADPANVAFPWRDTNQFNWYFRSSTTPSNLTVSNAANDILAGYNAIMNSHNDCGLADEVSASQLYKGNTNSGGNFSSTGLCQATGDNIYVVDWGTLQTGRVGSMCHWQVWDAARGFYEVTSADIKLSTAHGWFTGSVPSGCSNRWSVRSVLAHEAGHVFGLDHVPAETNGNLTMANSMHSCTLMHYTLGKGDVDLLRQLY